MEGCCRNRQDGSLSCADSEVWDFGRLIPVKRFDTQLSWQQRERDALNPACVQILQATNFKFLPLAPWQVSD